MTHGTMLIIYVALVVLEALFFRGLDGLNLNYMNRRSGNPPAGILESMGADHFQAAIRYNRDRTRFSMVSGVLHTLVILMLVVFALPGKIENLLSSWISSGMLAGIGTVLLTSAIFLVIDSIAGAYSQFVIEERHGFNRMSPGLFAADLVKSILLGLILGVPVLAFLLWSVEKLGALWWLWGFLAVSLFQLAVAFVFPVLIAPLFYKFTPLEDGPLKERITSLAGKTGFTFKSVQVMDGSRRSGHSNAFFTGFGSTKRIALFDTLIEAMSEEQIEAVVAHELGHAKLRHTVIQLAGSFVIMFIAFFLLGVLLHWPPLFTLFGFRTPDLAALLVIVLFFSSPLTFWLSPLGSIFSRRREFAADAFAQDICGDYRPLAEGLVVLQRDNRSNPVPHPWYSFVHYSHPIVWERVEAMKRRAAE